MQTWSTTLAGVGIATMLVVSASWAPVWAQSVRNAPLEYQEIILPPPPAPVAPSHLAMNRHGHILASSSDGRTYYLYKDGAWSLMGVVPNASSLQSSPGDVDPRGSQGSVRLSDSDEVAYASFSQESGQTINFLGKGKKKRKPIRVNGAFGAFTFEDLNAAGTAAGWADFSNPQRRRSWAGSGRSGAELPLAPGVPSDLNNLMVALNNQGHMAEAHSPYHGVFIRTLGTSNVRKLLDLRFDVLAVSNVAINDHQDVVATYSSAGGGGGALWRHGEEAQITFPGFAALDVNNNGEVLLRSGSSYAVYTREAQVVAVNLQGLAQSAVGRGLSDSGAFVFMRPVPTPQLFEVVIAAPNRGLTVNVRYERPQITPTGLDRRQVTEESVGGVTVDLVRESTGEPVASTETDDFGVAVLELPQDRSGDFRVIAYAEGAAARVLPSIGNEMPYSAEGEPFQLYPGRELEPVDLVARRERERNAPFAIMETIRRGRAALQQVAPGLQPDPVEVIWARIGGAPVRISSERIVLGEDEYDETVILSAWIKRIIQFDDAVGLGSGSPGLAAGQCEFYKLSPQGAFVDGFSAWFAAVVVSGYRTELTGMLLNLGKPDQRIDLEGMRGVVGPLHPLGSGYSRPLNIAAALWDLADAPAGDDDPVNENPYTATEFFDILLDPGWGPGLTFIAFCAELANKFPIDETLIQQVLQSHNIFHRDQGQMVSPPLLTGPDGNYSYTEFVDGYDHVVAGTVFGLSDSAEGRNLFLVPGLVAEGRSHSISVELGSQPATEYSRRTPVGVRIRVLDGKTGSPIGNPVDFVPRSLPSARLVPLPVLTQQQNVVVEVSSLTVGRRESVCLYNIIYLAN